MNRRVLIAGAIVEVSAGILFLVAPHSVAALVGGTLGSIGVLVSRVFGSAACTFGGLCWAASRRPGSQLARAMTIAMLAYQIIVTLLLLEFLRGGGSLILLALAFVHGILALAFGVALAARR